MEPCRGRLLAYGSCSYSDVCQGAQSKCVSVQTKTRSPPVLGTDTTKLAWKDKYHFQIFKYYLRGCAGTLGSCRPEGDIVGQSAGKGPQAPRGAAAQGSRGGRRGVAAKAMDLWPSQRRKRGVTGLGRHPLQQNGGLAQLCSTHLPVRHATRTTARALPCKLTSWI